MFPWVACLFAWTTKGGGARQLPTEMRDVTVLCHGLSAFQLARELGANSTHKKQSESLASRRLKQPSQTAVQVEANFLTGRSPHQKTNPASLPVQLSPQAIAALFAKLLQPSGHALAEALNIVLRIDPMLIVLHRFDEKLTVAFWIGRQSPTLAAR